MNFIVLSVLSKSSPNWFLTYGFSYSNVIILHWVEISARDLKLATDVNLIFSVICISPSGFEILK